MLRAPGLQRHDAHGCAEALGLRKSVVHYYFASKAALVQQVQARASNRYLELLRRGRELARERDGAFGLSALWRPLAEDAAARGLAIELWSEARRDEAVAERAAALAREVSAALVEQIEQRGESDRGRAEDLANLTQAVLAGLTVLAEQRGATTAADRAFARYLALLQGR